MYVHGTFDVYCWRLAISVSVKFNGKKTGETHTQNVAEDLYINKIINYKIKCIT